MEWVLVLIFSLNSDSTFVRDIQPNLLPGFTSHSKCMAAGQAISYKLISLAGKTREAQGVNKSSPNQAPRIYFECIQIAK